MARRPTQEIEIFNFSFLDILGCTIGALIFVLLVTMVGDMAQSAAMAAALVAPPKDDPKKIDAERRARQARDEQDRKRRQDEETLKRTIADLKKRIAEAQRRMPVPSQSPSAPALPVVTEKDVQVARAELEALRKQREALETTLARRTRSVMIPQAIQGQGGGAYKPIHVECIGGGVTIHPGRTFDPTGAIGGALVLLVERLKSDTEHSLVLWVRPDGVEAFDWASRLARRADIRVGWEPLEQDWDVDFEALSKE